MDGLDEFVRYNLAAVPDPGTLILIGTGVAGLGALWRRYVRWRGMRQEPAPPDANSAAGPTGSSRDDV